MTQRKIAKTILIISILCVLLIALCSCSKLDVNFSRDGSGTAIISATKTYIDTESGEEKEYTFEEFKKSIEDIVVTSESTSGMEDRVRIRWVKEYEDRYEAKLYFMRIQYLSKGGNGGDLGAYTYMNSQDFILEPDRVSILQDYWMYGSYKTLVKLVSNTKYTFTNNKRGNPDVAIVPTYMESGRELTEEEIEKFFSQEGELATNKRGKIFTFFIIDIKGLESVTFNFDGKINIYGGKNVENITKNSITLKPVYEEATIISTEESVKKNVSCFVGYVYFTANVSLFWVILGICLLAALIGFIIYGIISGKLAKAFKSKKFSLIVRNYDIYLMLLPAMTLLFLFAYLPMGGVVLAFKNYQTYDGIWGSEWTSMFGFKHFIDLFTSPTSEFGKLMANTFILAFWKFIFGFFLAIVLAVLFSYLKQGIFKKTVQTISYFPYFISWVVISTISYSLLATDGGVINKIREAFGQTEAINFYSSPQYWRFILTFSAMWKTAGYSTIVYLAAIISINPSLYEAARIDGAGRVQQLIHITIPGLFPVLGIQIVFSLGNLVRDDFDQIFTMIRGSAMLRETTDTIGMIVYENIGKASNYSGTAAMGLLQGLVALILVVTSNKVLKHYDIQGAY